MSRRNRRRQLTVRLVAESDADPKSALEHVADRLNSVASGHPDANVTFEVDCRQTGGSAKSSADVVQDDLLEAELQSELGDHLEAKRSTEAAEPDFGEAVRTEVGNFAQRVAELIKAAPGWKVLAWVVERVAS